MGGQVSSCGGGLREDRCTDVGITERIVHRKGVRETVRQLITAYGGLIQAAALLFPLVVAGAVVAMILRNRWLRPASALRISAVDAGLVYSGLVVVHLVSAPQPYVSANQVRLVPGNDLLVAVHAQPGDVLPWLQLVGNMLLLFPLGALLPLRVPWFDRSVRIALAALLTTGAIESTQFLFLTGRVVSADDVLLNTMGALLGAMATSRWWEVFREPARPPWVLRLQGMLAAPSGRHALQPRYVRSNGA